MDKKNPNQETLKSKNLKKNSNPLGLDPDEQAMNGLYGMVETTYEDSLPNSEKNE